MGLCRCHRDMAKFEPRLGDWVEVLCWVKDQRDRVCEVVYIGPQVAYLMDLKVEHFTKREVMWEISEAVDVGRFRPHNWKEMAKAYKTARVNPVTGKRVVKGWVPKPHHLFGPIIVRSVRAHKTTGKACKPRFFSLSETELKTIRISRTRLLMES